MENVTELECTLFPDNPHQCDVVIAVRRTTGALSLVGCFFMIVVIWLFKKYTVFAQRLILYLSIAAFFVSIAYLMGGLVPDGATCHFQAWFLQFFDFSVLLWVACITFNLFMNVVRRTTTEKFEWLYHVFCWGVSLVLSLLPFINDHYGPAGAWCWIESDIGWRVGIYYGPLFVILIGLVITYSYIVYSLYRKASSWQGTYDPDTERQKQMLKEDIKPLTAYPFVYIAVSIFPLINRIQNAVAPDSPVFALVVLQALSSPLQGAVNAVVYGLDRETFSRLTPSQLKMALRSHTSPQKPREYPLAYDEEPSSPSRPDRYSKVSYSRLH
ncbi:cyclic AMP receptor-like protein A isoform X1 [Mytilus edulis]|uniref:cyclic AMP receptor-like protein A isoform X1 n=1 Tax=Mytilus edulis TaxID=6550 RepID=UPI0039EF0B3B